MFLHQEFVLISLCLFLRKVYGTPSKHTDADTLLHREMINEKFIIKEKNINRSFK